MKMVRPWKRKTYHHKNSTYWKVSSWLERIGNADFVSVVPKPMSRYPEWRFWNYEKDSLD